MRRIQSTNSRFHAVRSRHGAMLIVVMVLLLVIAAIAASLLRTVLLDVRQSRLDRHALQADRLVEAGLARGRHAIAKDGAYEGETWQAVLPDGESATVEIRVIRADGQSSLEAVANYPEGHTHAVRGRRSMAL